MGLKLQRKEEFKGKKGENFFSLEGISPLAIDFSPAKIFVSLSREFQGGKLLLSFYPKVLEKKFPYQNCNDLQFW